MKNDVITEFDKADIGGYTFFFHPDHGYHYIAGSRIALYADQERWAVVFEKNGYANRGLNACVELNYFGNCLSNLDRAGKDDVFICNAKYFELFDYKDVCYDDDFDEHFEMLDPGKSVVSVRDTEIEIEHDPREYAKYDIELERGAPSIIEFIYLLSEKRPELLWASESELRTCLPEDLPRIGYVYEWNHDPDTLYEKPPSVNEAYRLIAECIEKRSMDSFRPTLKPNNHYKNWPEAGGL